MALIALHTGQMAEQSPEESCHSLDSTGLDTLDVQFFLLWQDGRAIAMGALKALSGDAFELKSMHTRQDARGCGAGRAMLDHLLAQARHVNAGAIYLETGSTDDFLPARRLYESYGFVEVPLFEGYGPDVWSVFMRLEMHSAA